KSSIVVAYAVIDKLNISTAKNINSINTTKRELLMVLLYICYLLLCLHYKTLQRFCQDLNFFIISYYTFLFNIYFKIIFPFNIRYNFINNKLMLMLIFLL